LLIQIEGLILLDIIFFAMFLFVGILIAYGFLKKRSA